MEFGVLKMKLIVAVLSLFGAFSHGAHNPEFNYKLPKSFRPINYTLDITTHLQPKFKFEGVVSINFICMETTSTMVLHAAADLEVDQEAVTLVDGKGNPMNVSCVSSAPQLDQMFVSVPDEFDSEEMYTVTIPFWGNITDDLVGYYRSSYLDQETLDSKWLAVTQFEPADARRAFPCFDEPAMKATFKIYLRHKQELNSFSNMPLIKRSNDPTHMNYVVQEFEETVPMSTYLVAYMVSDFVMVNSIVKKGDVEFRILCRKDAAGQTKLARKTGPLALKYFEEYFDQKFPSSKMDMVALPDFASGAMENWGLVTYRETALLVDPKVGTVDNSYRVAEVIAHELSHMWFGNMVTMKWWTDLWLNEGFATYVASRALAKLFPKWNTFQLETVSNFINVLELDALHSSHPVSVPVNHPDEIAQIFDTISYTKGSFLLHMMNQFLGESVFKQGIRNYIKKYMFRNAEQDELWSVMTKEAHRLGRLPDKMKLKEIMDTWTLQTGYPVVKVIRNYNHGVASITQERFFAIRSNGTKSKNCWWVPLTNTVSSKPDFSRTKPESWLNCEKNNELTMTLDKKEPWVIFNLQMAGLYRVMYDKKNWLAIIHTLNDPKEFKKIHTLNRAQLIDDSLSFSKVGDLDYAITFKLLSYLEHEDEYIPWSVAFGGMDPINKLLKRTPHHGDYEAYMRRVLKPLYNKFHDMTVELEEFEAIRFKNLVISKSCHNRLKACTEQAKELFYKWMKSPDPDSENNNILPKELKTTIYCQAAKHGGEEVWDFLWKRYQRSNVAAEKSKILFSLGCTTDAYLLHRYLNWTIGENAVIRKQDAYLVFYTVSNNDLGYYLARDFLYTKIKEISKYYHPRGDRVGGYIEAIGTEMKTKKELDEFQSFINKSKKYLAGTEMSVSQTIETIKINMEWMTNYYDKIIDYIDVKKAKDHKPESSMTRH